MVSCKKQEKSTELQETCWEMQINLEKLIWEKATRKQLSRGADMFVDENMISVSFNILGNAPLHTWTITVHG